MSVAVLSALTCLVLAIGVVLLIADRTLLKQALAGETEIRKRFESEKEQDKKDRAEDRELIRLLRQEVRELHETFLKCGTCRFSVKDEGDDS